MDKPILFFGNIYKLTREYIDYDKKATGFGVSLGENLSEYWWGNITYNFENAKIYNISERALTIVKEQEGTRITSSITPSLTRDSRDNYLDPSKGSRNSIYFTYAGIGGSMIL